MNELIEFQVDSAGVMVLAVLKQKHYQECDDGRTGIDRQLPSIRIAKVSSGEYPKNYQCQSEHESNWTSYYFCRFARNTMKYIPHASILQYIGEVVQRRRQPPRQIPRPRAFQCQARTMILPKNSSSRRQR